MKIAASVFNWISVVLMGIFAFIFLGLSAGYSKGNETYIIIISYFVIFLILFFVDLIIAIIAQYKLSNSYCKAQIVPIAIVTMIFLSLIGGILMLCMNELDL